MGSGGGHRRQSLDVAVFAGVFILTLGFVAWLWGLPAATVASAAGVIISQGISGVDWVGATLTALELGRLMLVIVGAITAFITVGALLSLPPGTKGLAVKPAFLSLFAFATAYFTGILW